MRSFGFLRYHDNYFKINEFLNICFKHTSYITMTVQFDLMRQRSDNRAMLCKKFMKEMEPFLIHGFDTTEWYCYYVTEENKLSINIYHFNEETIQILNSYLDNLFFIEENGEWSVMPQDICFFRKDKTLFLGTVSHENIAEFFLSEEEYNEITIPSGFIEVKNPVSNYNIMLPI